MDARVNDFLNEINEIAPLNETKTECVWEKCFDEESGYYYYWNTKTNEVTWDTPADYRAQNKTKNKKSCNLYIPPRSAPLFPSTSGLLPPVTDAIKIYKIGECTENTASSSINSVTKDSNVKEDKKFSSSRPFRKKGDSDNEKVVLISSYGGDSESEDEKSSENNNQANGSKPSTPNSDAEDDVDILTKIQRRATELRKLGGEISSEVKKIDEKPNNKNREISGFSLVAGYSDSEEESESETSKTIFPIASPPEESKVSHSTLFPVTKPIDIKDFEDNSKSDSEGFDSKVFKRKRRIGVALINTGKKTKVDDDGNRKGLGFTNENSNEDKDSSNNVGSTYPGFKSGGVMFVKSDVLNPPSSNTESFEESSKKVLKEIENTYTTLKEKLSFLSEGREGASPVQVMLIQLETLYTALKSGNLKQNYLKTWLEETCSDLIKLEKDTTPEGWLLQWDSDRSRLPINYRTHKRYYYQNAATGESQWEYPQADVTVCDEAMDICTTPPPHGAEPTIHMSPPLPPVIGSPSPPPPPKISDYKPSKKKKSDIPLPPEPKDIVTEKYDSNGEPLPPGVDALDASIKPKEVQDDMSDVLSSFYSDIAAIETSNSPPPAPSVIEDNKTEVSADITQEQTKKKKKTKVKLAQGIAMKKKGVSKLVEKWKNVQMSYTD